MVSGISKLRVMLKTPYTRFVIVPVLWQVFHRPLACFMLCSFDVRQLLLLIVHLTTNGSSWPWTSYYHMRIDASFNCSLGKAMFLLVIYAHSPGGQDWH
jgi:hypothetical protein